jgi:hypothetical protein
VSADIKNGTIEPADLNNAGAFIVGSLSTTGGVTISEGKLTDSTIVEADLKAVDAASDEDFLSYESTTGDFEWHSAAEIAGKFTEGVLADSIIVSADIKDGEVADADLAAATIGTAGADATKTHGATALKYVELTISSTNLATLADGAHGGGKVEFTFPAGLIYIIGCTATGTVVNSTNFLASANDTYSFAIGSATANDGDDLTSTEADILPKQTIDTASGTKASQVIGAVSTTPAMLNGVNTAAAVYLNYAIADACNHAGNTFGTSALIVKIWYLALGDI